MKIFWLRFSGFCLLWIFLIIQSSESYPISILFFTLAVGLYFFLSIRHSSIYLYSSLSAIIFLHGLLLTNEYAFTVFLLLYLTIAAAFWVKEKWLALYMGINFLLSVILGFLHDARLLELVMVFGFVYFLVVVLNRMALARKEQGDIYEQLLGEYRQLKRMNLVAEREARLEERTKIARDIHDSVGHRLTALIMKLEILAIQDEREGYGELKQMAEESLAETREAVKALQTEENEGIATVVHLIRKLESESHMLVQFTMKQGILSVPLSNEKSVALYRVIQEALTNAMRHSQSREVHIILGKAADGAISFEVTNQVFKPKVFAFGFGLENMKKRVEEIAGRIDIYQTDKQFVVAGTIPTD